MILTPNEAGMGRNLALSAGRMQEYRATVIEVSPDTDDSLLSFCPEGEHTSCPESESALAIAFQPEIIAAAPPAVPKKRPVRPRRRSGWAAGPLLFASGVATGAICAFVLYVEWPAHARAAAVSVQPSSPPQQRRVFAAGAPSPAPLPVATTGTTTTALAPTTAVAPTIARPLAKKTVHQGTLLVNSQPRGASIFLNGKYVGQTPMLMRALPAGSRAVGLRLDGYAPWSRGVSVVANEFTTVAAKLNPNKTVR